MAVSQAAAQPVRPAEPALRNAPANEFDVLTGALWVDGTPHGDSHHLASIRRQPAQFVDPVSQWLRTNEAAGAEFIESRADELAGGFAALDVDLVPDGQLAPLRAHYELLTQGKPPEGADGHRGSGLLAAYNAPVARALLLGLCPFVSQLCRRQLVPSHTSTALADGDTELPVHRIGEPCEVTLVICLPTHASDHRGASHLLLGSHEHMSVVRARSGRGAVIRGSDVPHARVNQGGPDQPWVLLLHYTE